MDPQRNQEFLEDMRLEVRDAAANLIAIAERYPDVQLPPMLAAAILVLKESLQ